ncbi:MAG: C25 family cysteine peptidase, partial [candidate division WOR-3 bacterium]|nr:C25 family cysteine peptidase [candidate division WOR-3 bacterium]
TQVPGRRARAVVSSTGNIPCDLYYADLQWSWDGNRNNIFGEMGSDTVDLFHDVYIGRVSCENSNEINTFITKTLTYEKNPPTDYLKKVLLPSVMLWSQNNYHGRIVNESIANITPLGFFDAQLIDPGSYQMFDSINRGYHYCHPAAHGNDVGLYHETGTPIYTSSQANSQTNGNRLTIMNSIACYPGNFEYSDCLAEVLMNNSNGGCVAVIMNSRYGWGTPPTMGPSEKLSIRFYDFLFLRDSIEIGKAHSRSKDFYQATAQANNVYRWCVYELNLFGNPSLPLWTDIPGGLTVQKPDTIQTGSQTLRIIVQSQGQPVANAKVGIYKENEVLTSGYTNSQGILDILINPITPGYLYVMAYKKNYFPKEESIFVKTGTARPHIVMQNIIIDDAGQQNPNGRLDPNETAKVYIRVKNIGQVNATNLIGKLRSQSNYILPLDTVSNYGNLSPNDSSIGDFYKIYALSTTPPGTLVNFELALQANEGNWQYNFDLRIGQLPQPRYVYLDHDTGYCLLTVTAHGGVGYDGPPSSDQGSGFRYPKTSSVSQLYYGSLIMGNSDNYVVDRFYSRPATSINTDFRLRDSIEIISSSLGDQVYYCSFDDGAHSTPKGIRIYQTTLQNEDIGYDDFVIYLLTIKNEGSQQVNNLYFGIICDFDVNPSAPTSDIARSDTIRKLIYMRNSQNQDPTVGFKLLSNSPLANLFCVDHARYVYPDTSLSEGTKFRILNGTLRQWQSNRAYDWSICLSVGPFNLAPNQQEKIAFAVLGGHSENAFIINADSAQSYYDNYLAGISEKPSQKFIKLNSTFFAKKSDKIIINSNIKEKATITLYDLTGREIERFIKDNKDNFELSIKKLNNGIYFLKIKGEKEEENYRIVILK